MDRSVQLTEWSEWWETLTRIPEPELTPTWTYNTYTRPRRERLRRIQMRRSKDQRWLLRRLARRQ
jgi:hypothetical protein